MAIISTFNPLTKSDYIPQRLFHNDYTATDDFGQATLFTVTTTSIQFSPLAVLALFL